MKKKRKYVGTVIPLEFEPNQKGAPHKLTKRCIEKLVKSGMLVKVKK